MKIYMNITRMGSEDGHTVKMFVRGKHYDVADTLGREFILKEHAVESKYAPMGDIGASLFDAFKPANVAQQLDNLKNLGEGI